MEFAINKMISNFLETQLNKISKSSEKLVESKSSIIPSQIQMKSENIQKSLEKSIKFLEVEKSIDLKIPHESHHKYVQSSLCF